MQEILYRLKNWKTTLGGSVFGTVMGSVAMFVLDSAGCDFSKVELGAVLAFAGPLIMGALSTDKQQPERKS